MNTFEPGGRCCNTGVVAEARGTVCCRPALHGNSLHAGPPDAVLKHYRDQPIVRSTPRMRHAALPPPLLPPPLQLLVLLQHLAPNVRNSLCTSTIHRTGSIHTVSRHRPPPLTGAPVHIDGRHRSPSAAVHWGQPWHAARCRPRGGPPHTCGGRGRGVGGERGGMRRNSMLPAAALGEGPHTCGGGRRGGGAGEREGKELRNGSQGGSS